MKTLTKNLREEIVAFRLSRLARDVKRQNLTYLTNEKLLRLQRTLRAVEASRTEGDFIEFGVALGGSAILIATAAKGKRRFLGFDVFGLIPEPSSEKDDETSRRRFKEIVAGASPGIGGTWRGWDFSDTGSSDCLKQPFSSRRHWHQTPTLHHGAAFPVEEAFAFQLRADIANRRLRPAINQVVQLSPADGADVSTIAAAAPRASNGFWQPHLPAPGSAAVEDSALPDASDDWFAAKEARAFAKSAQETAICSQVCFWISLGELSALRWQSFALAKYVSCLAR